MRPKDQEMTEEVLLTGSWKQARCIGARAEAPGLKGGRRDYWKAGPQAFTGFLCKGRAG